MYECFIAQNTGARTVPTSQVKKQTEAAACLVPHGWLVGGEPGLAQAGVLQDPGEDFRPTKPAGQGKSSARLPGQAEASQGAGVRHSTQNG